MKPLHLFVILAGLLMLACSKGNAGVSSPVTLARIEVVVNNQAITTAEIEERVRLHNLSAGKPVKTPVPEDLRKQIIQGMIEEILQLQTALKNKIQVPPEEIEKSLEGLARDNKMTLEAMIKMLNSHGISRKTMLARLRAQMHWARYIREKYASLVHISDQEIDKMFTQIQAIKPDKPSADQMIVSLCQAIFPVKPDTPEETMMIEGPKIDSTYQTKGCENFFKVAQEAGAQVGKNRTVKLGELPEALKGMISQAQVGKCLAPVMTPDGLVLIMVCSKKMPEVAPPLPPTRDMAANVIEQEKLGKRAVQEMAKLKTEAYQDWKQ